jgi:hypothetical protein
MRNKTGPLGPPSRRRDSSLEGRLKWSRLTRQRGGKSLCEGSSPFVKEISTIKVRYAKISIPGHATAHASGLFRTQRAPAPYTELARRGRGQRRQSRHDVEYLRDSMQKHVITLTYMCGTCTTGTCQTPACPNPYFASLLRLVLSILIPPLPPFRRSVLDEATGAT